MRNCWRLTQNSKFPFSLCLPVSLQLPAFFSSLFMAEKFAFNQAGWNGCTVDLYKGFIRLAPGVIMEGLG